MIIVELDFDKGCLVVQREPGEPAVRASGYTRDVHQWGAEHALFYRIRKALIARGFDVIKKRVQDDGHLFGDAETPYIRTRNARCPKPHFYVYDGHWQIRNSAEDYNQGSQVVLDVVTNIF